jgi:hypothetical protein
MSEGNMTTEPKLSPWRRPFYQNRFTLIWFSAVFLFGVLGSLFFLVKDPGIRNQEISKIAVMLVTVEGILVGLSPLLKTNLRGWVNLGLISILVSVVTVVVADTAAPDNWTYPFEIFILGLVLFTITLVEYSRHIPPSPS